MALVWRRSLGSAVVSCDDLGSNRRLWIRINLACGTALFICAYYLPVFQGDPDDVLWRAELQGLENDIEEIAKRTDGPPPMVLLLGDANVQPSRLLAGPDLRADRDNLFSAFLDRKDMNLCNPIIGDHTRVPIHLPIRDKIVMIRHTDTHHCAGASRIIDLVASSRNCPAQATIHNTIHCCIHGPCPWDVCMEFTLGDHFLTHVDLPSCTVVAAPDASPRLPRAWCDTELWTSGISAASGVMIPLSKTIENMCAHLESGSRLSKCLRSWVADVIARLLCVLSGVFRDAWVLLPTSHFKRRKVEAGRTELRGPVGPLGPDADKALIQLRQSSAVTNWPSACLASCCRWLHPSNPTPPRLLRQGERQLDEVESHKVWADRLQAQTVWPPGWDVDHHRQMEQQAHGLVGVAQARKGQGAFDSPFSQPEVLLIISK